MFNTESLFWFCALAGSGTFLIQLVLYFTGSGWEEEEGTSQNFKWISKQALTGFLMMFGWVGLSCKKEFGLSFALSILTGIAAGIFAMFVTASIFKLSRKLRSSGTLFQLEEAIGKEATVYQKIPKVGTGKISISLQNFTHEIDAISLNAEEIPSFSKVEVIKKADEHTLVVIPLNR